ncbi:MAG: phage terminase small subunit [Clostridia bacterium]|nr:phage terminase small subunit [Clostridia bacterium]
MPRQRNPERVRSLERYIKGKGKVTIAELAAEANVSEGQIRKWKSQDKWDDVLKSLPKKKGGQIGNKNAKGKTPRKNGNKNAETHGIYSAVTYGDLKDVELAYRIKNLYPDSTVLMKDEIKYLLLKAAYLEEKLSKYNNANENTFYTDRIVEMIAPKSTSDKETESDEGILITEANDPEGGKGYKTTVKSIIKSSAFERARKIEDEINKVHGRIIKIIDSMKSLEIEKQRLNLEERKLVLAENKMNGTIEDEPEDEDSIDVGEIVEKK